MLLLGPDTLLPETVDADSPLWQLASAGIISVADFDTISLEDILDGLSFLQFEGDVRRRERYTKARLEAATKHV